MLWALALLGALPAILMFNEEESGSQVGDEHDGEQTEASNEAALESYESQEVFLGGEAATTVEDIHAFEAAAGDAPISLTGFEPDQDTLTLSMNGDELGEFAAEAAVDESGNEIGVRLTYSSSTGDASITFVGLSEIPVHDIFIAMYASEAGGMTMYGLDELTEADALFPDDADAAEVQSLGQDDDIAIGAIAPDVSETPTYGADEGEVPILPEAPEEVTTPTDYVMSEEGQALVLPDDSFEGGISHITDFSVGADILYVTISTDPAHEGDLSVEVTQTEDGASSQLVVNGDVVAVLDGVVSATLDDVVVEVAA